MTERRTRVLIVDDAPDHARIWNILIGFEKDMEAAIKFYTSLVTDSAIEWITTIPADTPSGPAGSNCIPLSVTGSRRGTPN